MDLTKWVCIGRTGVFLDSQGREHRFTEQDFDAIKAAYSPQTQEAALCFGHPKDSDPAFGWVQDLKREGQRFFARFARVPAAVKKKVDDGFYRHVSMSLSPDKKRLLHVGLLGAAAPAMDGLGPVSFGTDGLTINFSFEHGGSMNPEELQRKIGELEAKIKSLEAENAALKESGGQDKKDREEAEKKAADVAAQFAAFKTQLATNARQARVRALVDKGQLPPALEAQTISFAAALAEVQSPVSFCAPDGRTEEISAEERYFRELEGRAADPRFMNFAAHAPAPAHAMNHGADYNPNDITGKL